MKDIHHTGVHGHWCGCDECSPYVPADKYAVDQHRFHRRIEVALTMLIVFALVIWIAAR